MLIISGDSGLLLREDSEWGFGGSWGGQDFHVAIG